MKDWLSKYRWAALGAVLGVVLIVTSIVVYQVNSNSLEKSIEWDLTLVGKNGEQEVLSYQEIIKMPSEEAQGGFFTTVGVVNGPFEVKGVPLLDLCDLVGGVTANDIVFVSAVDGYSMTYDYAQLNGDIQTYDPETIHEAAHDELKVLLTYRQDGEILPDSDGRPLRVAVVGNADLLTEGHYWVKWVDKIEVISVQ